ncbi:MAG: toll/interleukin-1 receptor domain-containing protein, partial [Limisphaerales bacterium]
MIDFFISYNKADELWATGIGDWLDQAGYSTVLQAQDFVPGANFVSEMHRALQSAKRVMLVLSPDYLTAKFPEAEWTAAFAKDPTNENKTIIPVRVRTCEPPGLLKPIVYIDLVGLSVVESQKRLLAGITSAIRGKRRSARKVPTTTTSNDQQPNQTVIGSGNYVAGRDFIMYHRPPAQKLVVEPLPGSISIEQRKQVHQWIETLAEG